MPDLRTQTVETVCVAEGSLQTNPGAECIWSCACASAACAKPGSRLWDPGLAEGQWGILTELPGSQMGLTRGAWGGILSPNRTLLSTGKMGRGREWGSRASHTVVPWTWEPGGKRNCSFFEKVGTSGPWTSGGTETKWNRRFFSWPSTGGRSGAVLAVSWERANSNISGLPASGPLRRLPGQLGAWLDSGGTALLREARRAGLCVD